jgi:excisionase family DNA binding protein
VSGLSLREAAKEAGTSKSTILRAVKAGRLSAVRTEDDGYSIDPAELFRVYPPEKRATQQDRLKKHGMGQGASAEAMADLRIQNGVLGAQLEALKDVLASERRRAEEIREDRERWHSQAERLALIAPKPAPVTKVVEPVSRPVGRFAWLKRGLTGVPANATSTA